ADHLAVHERSGGPRAAVSSGLVDQAFDLWREPGRSGAAGDLPRRPRAGQRAAGERPLRWAITKMFRFLDGESHGDHRFHGSARELNQNIRVISEIRGSRPVSTYLRSEI